MVKSIENIVASLSCAIQSKCVVTSVLEATSTDNLDSFTGVGVSFFYIVGSVRATHGNMLNNIANKKRICINGSHRASTPALSQSRQQELHTYTRMRILSLRCATKGSGRPSNYSHRTFQQGQV